MAEAGAKLKAYEVGGFVVTPFAAQLQGIPRGGRVLFVGGWNDRPPTDPAALADWKLQMRAWLEQLAAVAASRQLRVVRALLLEPEAAAETQLLEGLYAGVLPWSVLQDWPGFYRRLEPLEYWCFRSWQGAWGWKTDDHHRRWTPPAAAELVRLGNAALDAAEAWFWCA